MPSLEPQVTSWTDVDGRPHTVTTNPRNMDTQATLDARHAALVALMMKEFPEA